MYRFNLLNRRHAPFRRLLECRQRYDELRHLERERRRSQSLLRSLGSLVSGSRFLRRPSLLSRVRTSLRALVESRRGN